MFQDYQLTGMEGTVAGWGKTDNSFGKTGTNILNKVQVPIIDNRKCKRWHKEKVNDLNFNLTLMLYLPIRYLEGSARNTFYNTWKLKRAYGINGYFFSSAT